MISSDIRGCLTGLSCQRVELTVNIQCTQTTCENGAMEAHWALKNVWDPQGKLDPPDH